MCSDRGNLDFVIFFPLAREGESTYYLILRRGSGDNYLLCMDGKGSKSVPCRCGDGTCEWVYFGMEMGWPLPMDGGETTTEYV